MLMMDDDFYNDSIGDQILLELNITNFTPTLNDKNKQTKDEINGLNDNSHSLLTIPDQFFDFPYPKPYSQQLELMQTVYKTLESNCCGIFESPTGTGKSLSLLTATLRWLLDYNEKQVLLLNSLQSQLKLTNHENKENNSKEYDWIVEYDKNRLLKKQIEPQIEDLLIYQSNLQLIEKMKSSSSSLLFNHQTDFLNVDEMTITEANIESIDIEQLKNIIDNSNDQYDCDDELFLCKPDENLFGKNKIIELDEIELEQQFESQEQQKSDNGLLHVIYCSRTHSQLGQIAKEFAKCKTLFSKVTIIQLSSRNLLCTNETIYQLKHPDLINIACLELNRPRNREEGQSKVFRCPMRNSTAVNNLSKHLLIGNSALNITSSIRDRKSMNKLFSESNLDNINLSEFIDCLEYQHFIMKLIGFSKWSNNIQQNSKHLENVAISQTVCSQMTNLLNAMKRKYSDENNQCGDTSQVCISNKKSKIDIEKSEGIGSSLFKFHSFLKALEFCEEDARIIIEPVKNPTKLNLSISSSDMLSSSSNLKDDTQDLCLRVVFLNPGRYLKDLVQEARSVLLVGGTMQPFNEAIEQIFIPSGKLSNQIVTFTCDHVINAKKQLAVYPLGVHSHQSNGEVFSLDFTYQNRSNPHMIDACGEIILQICQQLPAGIVVFTPSYEYQSILHNHWEATGLLNKITKYKSFFHEPKTTIQLDQIMQAYGVAATQKLQHRHGALLLCVIGGKLSEGINFTDDLARVVIIIGMPYANPQSPILREKMNYLDKHFIRESQSTQNPGRQYYETMCMRLINQAIGRSIRHAKDYAVVFLLDNRYYRSTIQSQLPKWVQQSIIHQQSNDKQSTSLSSSNHYRKFLNLSEALEHAKRFFLSNKECLE
ncbi:unnamed protein product [Schistosoma mattheei]|uniref:Helicase ATP-binding domain-containing protein n=1 Tax=Schistosoma mattheei TaxID=31246 RepID=A0AA85BKI2_9TREM|nr:unnamed protein product [Schistosoma mattheei]